ncbi:MAG: energy-coupling factor transporter transmembrane protein EcfT [Haloarculaceae archaeon]
MFEYVPGTSLAHRLDPRSKLLVQVGFAAAAFVYTTPRGLAVLSVLALLALRSAGVRLRDALAAYRFVFPFLLAAPLLAMVTLGPPWLRPRDAVVPALSSYRVLLVLFVSAAYVRSTPVRDSQAALGRLLPGRFGRVLALGVGIVFRFVPALRRDLYAIRDAMAARLGTERPLHERMARLTATGLSRAFGRADRLALAMQARCLSWNPTLPRLAFSRADVPVALLGAGLLVAALVSLLPGG